MGRGAHGAEDGRGVEGGGGLLSIVGVSRWALHVVDGPPRGPRGRGWRKARHLRVRFCMHLSPSLSVSLSSSCYGDGEVC